MWRETRKSSLTISVADPGCLSRIPDPDFYPSRIPGPGSRIPDPKPATKERGEKKICHTFFCSHKFHKMWNYLIFELLKKKVWAKFQRIMEHGTQKVVNKLSKIWVWDTDPGSRGQKAPNPGSRIPNFFLCNFKAKIIYKQLCEICGYIKR